VSAFLAREDVMNVFTPGDHGSTFGGNPLGAAVACKALDLIVDGKLADRAAVLGADFMKALRDLDSPIVRQVRGMGLLIGVELHKRVSARAVAERLAQRGILTKETHGTVLRFAPPLVISETTLDEAITVIGEVFDEFAGPALKAA
jgi:ornithine--oxo-acid transaminase